MLIVSSCEVPETLTLTGGLREMNENFANTKWVVVKDKIKARWEKLTDDDIESFRENIDSLTGKIQLVYGCTKDHAEWEYKEFKHKLQSFWNKGR